MDKRGEVTSSEIVVTLLVIGGFVLLVTLLFTFAKSFTIEDDICRASVLTRATSSDLVEDSGQIVPLKCTTKKICISNKMFGGSCSQFAGDENVQTVNLKGSDEQKIQMVQEIMAQGMYSCWDSMGRGKLDLFSNIGKSLGSVSSKPTCVVCSRVAIADESSKDKEFATKVLDKIDMREYLKTTLVPGTSLTYLQTFTDSGVSSYPSVPSDISSTKMQSNTFSEEIKKLEGELALAKSNLDKVMADVSKSAKEKEEVQNVVKSIEEKLNLANENKRVADISLSGKPNKFEVAFVFSQIRTKSISEVLLKQAGLGGVAAGGAFAIAPKFVKNIAPTVAKRVISPTGIAIGVGLLALDAGMVGYNTWMSQEAAAGYCGEFTTGEKKAQEGCSIVQIIPYNFEDISKLCTSIQGSP